MKINREDWLLEEYRQLSLHYFHEDSQFKKTIVLFTTLNTAILGVYGSDLLDIEEALQNLFPIIGIVLSFTWIVSMIRIRELRNYIENRIKKIEQIIEEETKKDGRLKLDIKSYRNYGKRKKQNLFKKIIGFPYYVLSLIPASLSYLILPTSFICIWVWMLLFD